MGGGCGCGCGGCHGWEGVVRSLSVSLFMSLTVLSVCLCKNVKVYVSSCIRICLYMLICIYRCKYPGTYMYFYDHVHRYMCICIDTFMYTRIEEYMYRCPYGECMYM